MKAQYFLSIREYHNDGVTYGEETEVTEYAFETILPIAALLVNAAKNLYHGRMINRLNDLVISTETHRIRVVFTHTHH